MAATGEWRVPGYTEVRELGAGGGGRVVLATHDASGTTVAIKYLPPALRRDPRFVHMFGHEARVLMDVQDPNIARLYEYVQNDAGSAIVMEAVDGVPLRALLREHGSTGPEAALVVLKGSLTGLATAHSLGVVHRDYKPENVLVQADGASKLVDFGIAVRQGDVTPVAGTPPYMAPEQWAGSPASPATDVYAATAVFFECLTGHRPYRATAHTVLMRQHRSAPIPVDEVPEPVRGLIARGMAKDAAARPPGAAAFTAELELIAREAYGEDWEERGRRRLALLTGALVALFPFGPQVPQTTTTLFRTLLGAMRRNAAKLATGAGVAVVAAGTAVYVLASTAQRSSTIDIVAADPPSSAAPAVVAPPPTSEGPEPGVSPTASSTTPPAVTPTPPSSGTVPKPPVSSPASPPTTRPSTIPPTSPPTATSPTASSPTTTPSATKVTDVRVSLGIADAPGSTARAAVRVDTDGPGTVRLFAAFQVAGDTVASRTQTLNGAREYARALSHTFEQRPCGQTVRVTVRAEGEAGSVEDVEDTASVRVTCPRTPEPEPKPEPKPEPEPEPEPEPRHEPEPEHEPEPGPRSDTPGTPESPTGHSIHSRD
ncbi:serine/threonine protein kinase [Sinosporangium album]|uniref:non-specific serine/threonine protein kinase n=1 Tax=Sinosporangium album TaxID=504805 RepID=A0A1G8C2F8_9ACTN|nr:serine/threonine-protein kinase [Sinosporangium album]SDH39681.1 serine/threonine protein kinase [Sinosporangium album]